MEDRIAFTTTEIRDGNVDEWYEQIQAQPWCLDANIDPESGNNAPYIIGIAHRSNDVRVASWLKDQGLPSYPVTMNVRVEGDKYKLNMESDHIQGPLEFEAPIGESNESLDRLWDDIRYSLRRQILVVARQQGDVPTLERIEMMVAELEKDYVGLSPERARATLEQMERDLMGEVE